jgi:hypothetical protein
VTIGDPAAWDDFVAQKLIPLFLDHVVSTWEDMAKPAPDDWEDEISVKLYSAMVKSKDRQKHAFLIRYQDVEVDTDLARETGRKDIVVFPSFDEDVYFCLEAKRLNATVSGVVRTLADEYAKDGMQRFVDGKYGRGVRHGGMLGYVLDGEIARAIESVQQNIQRQHVALRMNPPGQLLASSVRPADGNARETRHHRAHETVTFCIHHLFVG